MKFARKSQRILLSLLFVSFLFGIILGISLITDTDLSSGFSRIFGAKTSKKDGKDTNVNTSQQAHSLVNKKAKEAQSKKTDPPHLPPIGDAADGETSDTKQNPLAPVQNPKTMNLKPDVQNNDDAKEIPSKNFPKPMYNAHIFYYPWYGNPKVDANYIHWNHVYLPHWDKKEAAKWPKGKHKPPDDIGASFYPELGAYSSRDAAVLDSHMQQIRSAGIGVLAVSWYPPGTADDNGLSWDDLMAPIMDHAHRYELKVCFHIEPFKDRNRITLKKNIEFIIKTYGSHPAFYRYYVPDKKRELPLFYLYDSYLVGKDEWSAILAPSGDSTLRGTEYDGVFIGLFVEQKHRTELISSHFDGFYTYFASDGFTFGSSSKNWHILKAYATKENMLFIPSIGPGYNDERVRPWNARNTKGRENGGYYEQSFEAALNVKPAIITITSFNEWHEGSQIEKAIPKSIDGFKYADYTPMEPDYYLSLTRKWLFKWKKQKKGV